MQPVVADLERKCSKHVTFSHINVDVSSNRTLVRKYGAYSIPKYVLLDSAGNIVQQWIGASSASRFNSMLPYCGIQ